MDDDDNVDDDDCVMMTMKMMMVMTMMMMMMMMTIPKSAPLALAWLFLTTRKYHMQPASQSVKASSISFLHFSVQSIQYNSLPRELCTQHRLWQMVFCF